MQIEQVKTTELKPYVNNSRTHSSDQVAQIAASIREFGFTNPVLIDQQGGIIAGHGRVMAAEKLQMNEVPCLRLVNLTQEQKRAYTIADNQLALNAGWDVETLAREIEELQTLNFSLDLLGFDEEDLENLLSENLGEKTGEARVEEWDLDDIYDPFWIVIRGPVDKFSDVSKALKELNLENVKIEASL